MEDITSEEFSARLDRAIAEAFNADGGRLVNKYVLVAEVLTEDDREVRVWPSEEAQTWEVFGLLEYGREFLSRLEWQDGINNEVDN